MEQSAPKSYQPHISKHDTDDSFNAIERMMKMGQNTWGLGFTRINTEADTFETLLELNTGNEAKTRKLFEQIKAEFVQNDREPDCLIDLLDEDDSIVDDYPVTLDQAKAIADKFGQKLKFENRNCVSCGHSSSDDEDNLHCSIRQVIVADNDSCNSFN